MRAYRWTKRISGEWHVNVDVSLDQWTFGLHYENALREMSLSLGPLMISAGRLHDTHDYWPSGTLWRRRYNKLVLRLEWSTYQFLFGYARTAWHDHGLYFGPIDLQIEYGKLDLVDAIALVRAKTLDHQPSEADTN